MKLGMHVTSLRVPICDAISRKRIDVALQKPLNEIPTQRADHGVDAIKNYIMVDLKKNELTVDVLRMFL